MSKSTRHHIESAVEVILCRLVNEVRIPWDRDRDQKYCETKTRNHDTETGLVYSNACENETRLSSCWDGRPFDHNRHGVDVPLLGGAGSPSNIMWPGPRLPPYQVVSWPIQPFGHNRIDVSRKGGGAAVRLFGKGSWAPSNTMWRGRGLPPQQVAS